jgi:hypothetical protein
MTESIELQVISKILTSDDEQLVNELCSYDSSYYAVFPKQIEFILDHRERFGNVPDVFTFLDEFQGFGIVDVTRESKEFLITELKKNKKRILVRETFNKLKELGSGDVNEAWEYLNQQCDRAAQLDDILPMDIIADAEIRANQVEEWSKQKRIPTGFAELDKLTYGGWSTVEDVIALVAGTNSGKSWMCAKMMEAAHNAGFPIAFYSPEMQAPYLATRFDTWRAHFKNSDLFQGKYTEEYRQYIRALKENPTPAFVIEDKDMPNGVSPRHLGNFIKQHGIKLLIVDGISYMVDDRKSSSDYERLMHVAHDLFQISKRYGCAIVIAVQANRETKDAKDEKGVPFPSIYNVAGSFAIVQIATLVFAMRQIFDKHVFEFKMEKARMAKNDKSVLSYSWDANTGNMQYMQGEQGEDPMLDMPKTTDIIQNPVGPDNTGLNLDLTDGDDKVEF